MNFQPPARETIKSAPAITRPIKLFDAVLSSSVSNDATTTTSNHPIALSTNGTGNKSIVGVSSSSSSVTSSSTLNGGRGIGIPSTIPAAREPVWSAPAVHAGWYGVVTSSSPPNTSTGVNLATTTTTPVVGSSINTVSPISNHIHLAGNTGMHTNTIVSNVQPQSTTVNLPHNSLHSSPFINGSNTPLNGTGIPVTLPNGGTIIMNDPHMGSYGTKNQYSLHPHPIYYSTSSVSSSGGVHQTSLQPNDPSSSSTSTNLHSPSSLSSITPPGYTNYTYAIQHPMNNNGTGDHAYYIHAPSSSLTMNTPSSTTLPSTPSSSKIGLSSSSSSSASSSAAPYEPSEISTSSTTNDTMITNIFSMLQHQVGCRSLQVELDKNDKTIRDNIFQEILPIACPIACSTFGNYVLQRLLNSITPSQRTALVRVFVGLEPYAKDDPAADTYKSSVSSVALDYLRTWETNVLQSFNSSSSSSSSNNNNSNNPATAPLTNNNDTKSSSSSNANSSVETNPSSSSTLQGGGGTLSSFIRICMDVHGTRVIQRLLEIVTNSNDLNILLDNFTIHKGYITQLACDANSNHIIQRLLTMEKMDSVTKFRIDTLIPLLIQDILFLSCQRHGAVVVQKALEVITDLTNRQALIQSIISCAPEITDDPCGNFVVGHIFQYGSDEEVQGLVQKLKGRWFAFAMQKCASNVVEKAITRATDEQRQIIIEELCRRQTGAPNTESSTGADKNTIGTSAFHMLLQSQYGNFVVQSAITAANNDQLQLLINHLRPLFPILPNTPGGRRIIQRIVRKQPDLEKTIPELQSIMVQSANNNNHNYTTSGGNNNSNYNPNVPSSHGSFHGNHSNNHQHQHHHHHPHSYHPPPNTGNYYPPSSSHQQHSYPPNHHLSFSNNYNYNNNNNINNSHHSRPSSGHQSNRSHNNNNNNNNNNSSGYATHDSTSKLGFTGRFPSFGWGTSNSNNPKYNKQ